MAITFYASPMWSVSCSARIAPCMRTAGKVSTEGFCAGVWNCVNSVWVRGVKKIYIFKQNKNQCWYMLIPPLLLPPHPVPAPFPSSLGHSCSLQPVHAISSSISASPDTRAASHPGPPPLLAAVTQYRSPLGSCSQLCPHPNLPLPNYKAPAFVDATSTGLISLVGHRNPRAGKPAGEKKQSYIVLFLLYMVLGTSLVCLCWEVIPRNISHFLMGMKANGNLQLNLSFCF